MLMSAAFYVAFVAVGGGTVETARADGWVFSTNHADSGNGTGTGDGDGDGGVGELQTDVLLQFVNVWTVRDFKKIKWELLCQSSFLMLIFKTFVIGLLTMVEDIFATLQVCSSMHPEESAQCEIDAEVRTGGIANMVLALVGGLPANVVFSYGNLDMLLSRFPRASPPRAHTASS